MSTKYCVNCTHYEAGFKGCYGICRHPSVLKISLVTGLDEPQLASVQRTWCACGSEGTLFEPIAETHDLPTGSMGGMSHQRATGRGV